MIRKLGAAVAAVVTSALFVAVVPSASQASSDPARQTGKIVSEDPVDYTPGIVGNGDSTTTPATRNTNSVFSIAKVGNEIVVGGKFTQVVDNSGATPVTLDRTNAFAFDANTGKVSQTFRPDPSGQVDKVLAGRDNKSVYLGGAFRGVRPSPPTTTTLPKRVTAERLAKFTVSSGKINPSFKPAALDGRVLDLENVGSRLWVAGRFTHVGSTTRRGIATLDRTSGKRSSYYNLALRGVHNPKYIHGNPQTFVKGIAVNPAQTQVVAVGNFTSVDGKTRDQIAKLSLGRTKAALSPWTTPQFHQRCSNSFETNMTDVQYSPGGSYFVVSTTGAYGGSVHTAEGVSGCDVVARFSARTSAPGSRPSWTAYTGGDSTWTIEVTDNVVYVGGHQRWQNNPDAGDAPPGDDPHGPGAVSRLGIAALDPVNGLPYSWNPTRAPGVGVQDMLATDDGLYVGSDTDRFARETHAKLAFVPLEGGKDLPPGVSSPALPADVYTVKDAASPLLKRKFFGKKTYQPKPGATGTDAPDWSTVVGAFMIQGQLYTGQSDGTLTRRSFDGTSYGPPKEINAGDALVRQTDWHGDGTSSHPGDVPNLTSIFYYHGFIYYTLSGSDQLYKRGFELDTDKNDTDKNDLVGELRSATPLSHPDLRGAFVANGRYFFASPHGYLSTMKFTSTGPTGKATVVSGPTAKWGSQNWASKVAFVFQGGS